MWLSGRDATLPNDWKKLATIVGEKKISPRVKRMFRANNEGRLHEPQLTLEWEAACIRASSRKEKAQNAAQSRWNGGARSMPQASPADAPSMGQASHMSMLGNASETETKTKTKPRPEESKPSCSPPANEVISEASHPRHSLSSEPAVTPASMEAAGLLRQLMLENNPRATISERQLVSWAREVDLMVRVDKRSHEEIVGLVQWAQADRFWKAIILSARKLREKFDQLILMRARAQKEFGDAKRPGGQESFEERRRRKSAEAISEVRERADEILRHVESTPKLESGEQKPNGRLRRSID
jgi:hypothetical protein